MPTYEVVCSDPGNGIWYDREAEILRQLHELRDGYVVIEKLRFPPMACGVSGFRVTAQTDAANAEVRRILQASWSVDLTTVTIGHRLYQPSPWLSYLEPSQ